MTTFEDCTFTTSATTDYFVTNEDWNNEIKENEEIEKHLCSYCESTSPDDSRGNCCACGAPRTIKEEKPFYGTYMGSPVYDAEEWAKLYREYGNPFMMAY